MRHLRFLFIGLFVFTVFALGNSMEAGAATAIDTGYLDFQFPSSLGNKEVTAEKPESKLWWNDGYWWASMWSSSGNAYHIFKLNWTTQDWTDTGTPIDDRTDSKADALWDGTKLYVVSHIWSGDGSATSAGNRGELYRYSYSSGNYSLDSGFPVEVSGGDSEALVIDKDSTGMLWVTYVQDRKVYVNHSVVGDDTSWVGPYVLPVGSAANVDSDDLSSIVAYDGHIGVMWSSQTSGNKIFFAVHVDGADDQTWQSVGAYTTSGDDHINLKSLSSDGAGNVFAAVKTSQSAALLLVMVCKGDCSSASSWSVHTAYTGSDGGSPTRPVLLLDTSNRDLYFFARVKDGTNQNIFYKRSDMDNISFPSGPGDPFIESGTYTGINDPTTTKQTVNNTTGVVVMASDAQARYYFHNCIELSGASTTCLEANPTPSVYFSNTDISISETGAPTAEVIVELSQSMPSAVSVNYTMQDDSATDGDDYTASNGTLNFAVGDTVESIFVPILDDTSPENDETVTLTLSNASGIDLGTPDTATVTIVDDDTPPEIAFGSATYSVAENLGLATGYVTLSRSYSQAVTVSLATADGTATAGSDYTAILPTTLTFNPYQLSQQINVSITNDAIPEADETVLLTLSNASVNASLGTPSTATLTIFDNELPSVRFSSASYSESESGGSVTVTVELDMPSSEEVNVNYATSDNTATHGTDYEAKSGKLTFAPSITSQTFSVPILNDDLPEPPELINLTLSSFNNAVPGIPAAATITIVDDDKFPTITLDAATYDVDENGGSVKVTVNLSEQSASTVSVNYATSDGTAHSGSDYTSVNDVLTFDPGDISQSFWLSALDDPHKEGDEVFTLSLSNPDKGILGTPNQATITIADDESPPSVSFKQASYTVVENQGQVTITAELNRPSDQEVTVDYATADGTANAGDDYESASGQLTFPPNETSRNFTVYIVNNDENEQDETFSLNLSNAATASLSMAAKATVTIRDDDRPTVQFSNSSYNAYGTGMATINVILNAPAAATVTVQFATSDGSATAGIDYTTVEGTLVFKPGSTSETFVLPILAASSTEKTVNITLSSSQKADLGVKDSAVLKILQGESIFLPILRG
jgi:hypothetical protein